MSEPQQIQHLPVDQVCEWLGSRADGLVTAEIQDRLREVGRNTFERKERGKHLRSLLKQFTNFFTILLNVSAVICFIADAIQPGESMNVLGYALFGVSSLNALFSFIQEYRAEKAMEALQRFLPQKVTVRRENQIITVLAEELVPGDILILHEGDRIPADARIIKSESLTVNNAPLTGESRAQRLHAGPVQSRLAESENVAFAGSNVLRGSGEAVIFATGLRTEFGKLAQLSQEIRRPPSPLERETGHMVRVLTVIATVMGVAFFLYGVFTGRSLWVNLVFMMGIIVANVPEGLLPTFTLSLAMASLRMARKNVLVKGLSSVESLGAVHVICTDKTGTLTENRLTVTHLESPLRDQVPVSGYVELLRAAMVASEVQGGEDGYTGDPLDTAIARRYEGLGLPTPEYVHRFAFEVGLRRQGGVEAGAGFAVKGAWEALRPLVSGIRGREVLPANEETLAAADLTVHRLASQGLRVIAVAGRRLTPEEMEQAAVPAGPGEEDPLQATLESDLILEGFLGVEDPLRREVPPAVRRCHRAGIDVILITGDHPDTALAVARQSRIVPRSASLDSVLTGDVLENMTREELVEALGNKVRVFARTTPEQKMKIVSALKARDLVVAMTGDGVNDAPALKAADVGIAMGRDGTDVARESAQIILLDDNFASIVAGIEEGRAVFANIKRFTNYVLVSNGPEIVPYLLYVLFPVPLALSVIHILSIDLGTDIVPSMALGQEPPDPGEMERPPRKLNEGLLTPALILHSYGFLGLIEAAWSIGLFFLVMFQGGWEWGEAVANSDPVYRSAMGMALATILLMQIGNLIGRRYRNRSGLDRGIFRNRLLISGIVIQIVFACAVVYAPPFHKVFNTLPVSLEIFALGWLGVPLIFVSDYVRKQIARRFFQNGP